MRRISGIETTDKRYSSSKSKCLAVRRMRIMKIVPTNFHILVEKSRERIVDRIHDELFNGIVNQCGYFGFSMYHKTS
ncbi:Hypothetical predicted protein [Octopus vulgaris]|uniref:Uncharacterized protein n=1 Tax=Octopus vulgaris TaxID=6645 RepID=A0AA36F6L0_OCTVU|nr:Hypothetical predicted protein [Octopus vulgaris]